MVAALAVITSMPSPVSAAGAHQATRVHNDSGSLFIRLLDVPVVAANDPRARQYIVDNLAPGDVIHRRVELLNTTGATLHVAVYPDAAHISHGSFIGAPGHTVNDLVTWTRLAQPTVDLPAGARMNDTVTIAVPRDAPPGERYGVIWA